MSNADQTKSIEPVDVDGHTIFVGADRFSNPAPHFFYLVTLQFQERPGVTGFGTRSGLIIPREGSQTAEWTLALLGHLYKSLPTWWEGRETPAGFPVYVHIVPNETYREGPGVDLGNPGEIDLSDFDKGVSINL